MNKSTASIEVCLSGVPMFTSLSAEEIAKLALAARVVTIDKGEILFHKDDPCHGFYLIASGKIKLAFTSSAGNEKIVEILVTGHTFGEAVMFMDKPYPVSAHALADSQLIFVTKSSVFEALDTNPLFARKLLTGLSIKLHQLIQHQELHSLSSGKQRVADYLLRQVADNDAKSQQPTVVLAATKAAIASHLGITPEHFSRILHEMVEENLITVNGKNIRIQNLQKTRELIAPN